MLGIHTLFNIHKLTEDCEIGENKFTSVLSNAQEVNFMIGAPAVAAEKRLREAETRDKIDVFHSQLVDVIYVFPPRPGVEAFTFSQVHINTLSVRSNSWIDSHIIKTVDEIDMSNIRTIQEYVDRKNSITLRIEDKEKAYKCIKNLSEFFRRYKYNYCYRYHRNGHPYVVNEGEDVIVTFSFLKLADCISIFNSKKVDGLAIMIQATYEDTSLQERQWRGSLCLSFIISNYKDNIIYVDGTNITGGADMSAVGSGTINSLLEYLTLVKPQLIKKPSEEKIKEGDSPSIGLNELLIPDYNGKLIKVNYVPNKFEYNLNTTSTTTNSMYFTTSTTSAY